MSDIQALQPLHYKIFSTNQTGSIKGRYIETNFRTIFDAIHYCNIDNSDGTIMALDFRNTFSSVKLSFVQRLHGVSILVTVSSAGCCF